MGDRSAEMLNIMIAIIAVVALMALGFAVFTISKRMANNSQNDLVNQLSDISQSLYTDLDQKIITGARLKQVVKQANTTDCAILINTLALTGATVNIASMGKENESISDGQVVGLGDKAEFKLNDKKAEASTNGELAKDAKIGTTDKVPLVMAENYPVRTSLGTQCYRPVLVNYGSILKNGIYAQADGDVDKVKPIFGYDTSKKTWVMNTGGSGEALKGWGDSAEYAQTICYKDGQFVTKLEFATNMQTSRILRYDSTADFDKSGKTMSISDTQQYNSYILQNAGGDYVGLVFFQIRK